MHNKMSSTIDAVPAPVQQLYHVACKARENAYSPYSGYQVGAAIRLVDGSIYTGCNVENASYGATNCAERVAIQKAVSEHGAIVIAEVMVVTDSNAPWPPCGMCRQVIAEFGADCIVYYANLQGKIRSMQFSELLPYSFTPDHLKP